MQRQRVDPATHDRICEIFDRAIRLPEHERAALLDRSCGDDALLRAEVDSLIDAHRQADPILDAGAMALLAGKEDDEHPDLTGQRIGRYELTRVIARGGMGIVYEAMQEQPRRTVAVKVLRRLGSPSAVRRFHDEAQILARLNHAHIAHVYEAGTHHDASSRGDSEQLPFFAMEYISGARPLTEFAVEQGLPIRERLLLFVKVCEAVQHGHQKGIIHRDLKPANILVDANGVPKVIDFGVARVLDLDGESRTRQTIAGRVIGTLPYCSPEQIDENAGDIDVRTDVYALGTVLYELLAGVPAFKTDGRSTWQAMTMIRESSPRPLRDLDRGFRGNLDAIVSRAMEKNPDRRYQSVESLQRDIERHLAGEPIEARPQSLWIDATRWMGRHPVLTAALAASTVAGTIIVITVTAIAYGLRQPARLEVANNRNVGHLVTAFGRPLATLGGEDQSRVMAKLVDRPASMGGGRIALIIVSSGEHSTSYQLWACDPKRLSQPLWSTSEDEPSDRPGYPAGRQTRALEPPYVADNFSTADVFADRPGEEVIVIHKQLGASSNFVSVYDLGGDLLFRTWHMGDIGAAYWWPQAELLVCGGERQWTQDIEQYGYVDPPPYPRVLFALKPRLKMTTGWINEPGWRAEWRSDADFSQVLAWYKYLEPKALASLFGMAAITQGRTPRGGEPHLSVTFSTPESSFDLKVNARGEQIDWDYADEFRQSGHLSLGPPQLVDWPPTVIDP